MLCVLDAYAFAVWFGIKKTIGFSRLIAIFHNAMTQFWRDDGGRPRNFAGLALC